MLVCFTDIKFDLIFEAIQNITFDAPAQDVGNNGPVGQQWLNQEPGNILLTYFRKLG